MGNCCCYKQTEDAQPPKEKTSENALQQFVDSQLKDPALNSGMIPDSLEKEMYLNVLKVVIANLHHVTDSIKIEILNHVITLQVQPK